MTNGEKYKTAQERAEAFEKFCIPREVCDGCELDCEKAEKPSYCQFAWLDIEYKEEMFPCPFCGERAYIDLVLNNTVHQEFYHVKCFDGCGYVSKGETSITEAIAAHNRVAKAVKESEVKE